MKTLFAPILAAALAVSATTAFAGGPVIIEDTAEVVPEKAGSSIGILPIILVTVALCAALCGGGDDNDDTDR
jgi:hypothetical protein